MSILCLIRKEHLWGKLAILFMVMRNWKYFVLQSLANVLGLRQVLGFELPGIDCRCLCEGAWI